MNPFHFLKKHQNRCTLVNRDPDPGVYLMRVRIDPVPTVQFNLFFRLLFFLLVRFCPFFLYFQNKKREKTLCRKVDDWPHLAVSIDHVLVHTACLQLLRSLQTLDIQIFNGAYVSDRKSSISNSKILIVYQHMSRSCNICLFNPFLCSSKSYNNKEPFQVRQECSMDCPFNIELRSFCKILF